MRAYQYPQFDTHRAAHEKLAGQLNQFRDQYRSGTLVISGEVMRFLKSWLIDHIQGVDKKYSAHLRKAGAN